MHGKNMSAYSVLEPTLKDILSVITPLREDWLMRVKIIEELQSVVNSLETLRGASVEPFGSFVSNLFTRWGDLDISVMFNNGSHISFSGRKRKQNLLEEILGALRQKGGWRRLRFISDARVPILKLEYGQPGISCDISIDNLQGQMKSKFLYWINKIDGRFRDMVLLVKEWAKAQNINNPKFGTFNSYSLSLLVIFHFQTCEPAILPPLKDIYPRNAVDDLTGVRSDAERRIEEACNANIMRYQSDKFRAVNRSSLSELFVSFLAKFSDISVKAGQLGICPFTGRWEDIRRNTRWLPRTYALFIEDPFEQPENTARAVSAGNLGKISEAFRTSYHKTVSPTNQIALLCTLVGPKISHLIAGTPVGNPGYSNGQYLRSHPQTSRTVYTPPLVHHQISNGRPDNLTTKREGGGSNGRPNNLTTKREGGGPNSFTRKKREDNSGNSTKQRQVGGPNNLAKQRPAQQHQSQSQQMWRPKSER